jgi:hypothetical protein
VTALVNGGNAGWDPRPNMAGRKDCPDDYCGYSPNQMGAMDPKQRAVFMPMTDLKTYPKAMKPAWNNKGLSQGMFCNAFLSGAQWKDWNGQMVVGFAGYRHSWYFRGQPPGSAEGQCRWVVCNEDRFLLADGRRAVPCL